MLTARDEAESRIDGARARRRRLCRQAVRAARAVAAHRQHPQARAARPPRRRSRSVRFGDFVFHLGARRAASAARRSSTSPTASATCCACSPARRARPCRAWRSPATAARSNERAVDVQVNRLRRKIERDPANPLIVQTVRGIGYRLVVVAMTSARRRHRDACARRPSRVARRLGRASALVQELHAEGPLCPRAADHHRADGDAAVGGRLRVHGAALEHGDAAAVGRRWSQDIAALIDVYRELSAGRRHAQHPPHRAGAARPGGRFPARRPTCRRPGRSRSSRCSTRRCRRRSAQADRPAVLDRHGRPLGAGRDPHPARRHGDARVRAAQRRLCVELGHLPALDGRHLAGAARPSPSCSCATRSSRSCGSPTPPRASARAARCRTSGRAARARCAARRRPSSR